MAEPPGTQSVIDASAFLAYLQNEEGAEVVQGALAEGSVMSAVNWAEVLSKVADLGHSCRELIRELRRRRLLGNALQIEGFGEEGPPVVGELRPTTRTSCLSLGDRACLALGSRLGVKVLTADRAWANLGVDVEVELIR